MLYIGDFEIVTYLDPIDTQRLIQILEGGECKVKKSKKKFVEIENMTLGKFRVMKNLLNLFKTTPPKLILRHLRAINHLQILAPNENSGDSENYGCI